MRAEFDGQDYFLFLASNTELQKLQQEKIESRLIQAWQPDNDLGKIISLELAENKGMDGIELKHLPDGAKSWEAIQEVQIKINNRAYNHIAQHRQFGTRYNGSDKVEIIIG
jgi:hypothetical protein